MNETNMKNKINPKDLILKFKEWSNYLFKKWKIILLFILLGSTIGYYYAKKKKTIYIAELTFAVEEDKPMGVGGSLALTLGIDLGGSNNGGIFSSSNMIELFKSRRMIEKTLLTSVPYNNQVISLADMYILSEKNDRSLKKISKENLIFYPIGSRKTFDRSQDSILGNIFLEIKNNLLLVEQLDKKTSIIKLELKSSDELFSKYFIETLAQVVSDDYKDTKSKKSRINMNVLQRQTDSVRSELNRAISGVAIANDNTFNLNPALNIHRVPSAKKEVDIEANTAILTELIKQLEMSKVSVRKDTPLIQVIDKPILPLNKEVFSISKGIILGGFISFVFVITGLIFVKTFKYLILND